MNCFVKLFVQHVDNSENDLQFANCELQIINKEAILAQLPNKIQMERFSIIMKKVESIADMRLY